MYMIKSLGGFEELAEHWLVVTRYFRGLTTFKWHHLAMSIFIPRQTNLVLISGFVALCEGRPKPCKFVKTFFRNFAVIYGLMCPVDKSHQIKILSNDLSNLKFNVEDIKWHNRINSVSKA